MEVVIWLLVGYLSQILWHHREEGTESLSTAKILRPRRGVQLRTEQAPPAVIKDEDHMLV